MGQQQLPSDPPKRNPATITKKKSGFLAATSKPSSKMSDYTSKPAHKTSVAEMSATSLLKSTDQYISKTFSNNGSSEPGTSCGSLYSWQNTSSVSLCSSNASSTSLPTSLKSYNSSFSLQKSNSAVEAGTKVEALTRNRKRPIATQGHFTGTNKKARFTDLNFKPDVAALPLAPGLANQGTHLVKPSLSSDNSTYSPVPQLEQKKLLEDSELSSTISKQINVFSKHILRSAEACVQAKDAKISELQNALLTEKEIHEQSMKAMNEEIGHLEQVNQELACAKGEAQAAQQKVEEELMETYEKIKVLSESVSNAKAGETQAIDAREKLRNKWADREKSISQVMLDHVQASEVNSKEMLARSNEIARQKSELQALKIQNEIFKKQMEERVRKDNQAKLKALQDEKDSLVTALSVLEKELSEREALEENAQKKDLEIDNLREKLQGALKTVDDQRFRIQDFVVRTEKYNARIAELEKTNVVSSKIIKTDADDKGIKTKASFLEAELGKFKNRIKELEAIKSSKVLGAFKRHSKQGSIDEKHVAIDVSVWKVKLAKAEEEIAGLKREKENIFEGQKWFHKELEIAKLKITAIEGSLCLANTRIEKMREENTRLNDDLSYANKSRMRATRELEEARNKLYEVEAALGRYVS